MKETYRIRQTKTKEKDRIQEDKIEIRRDV